MSTINVLDIYNQFGNFFEIDCSQMGKVYVIGDKIDETIDEGTVTHYMGKYLSYLPYEKSIEIEPNIQILQRFVGKRFSINLKNKGYELRKRKMYCAYRATTDNVTHPHQDIFSVYKGFVYRILILEEKLSLCIDPHLTLETKCSIDYLARKGIDASELNDFSVHYTSGEMYGIDGYLISTEKGSSEEYICKIKRYRKTEDEPPEEIISANKVFPEPRPELIQRFLERLGLSYDVIGLQRSLSFLDSKTASKDRFRATLDIVNRLSEEGVFPLEFGGFIIKVKTQPMIIKEIYI